jgi:hypothetical protein
VLGTNATALKLAVARFKEQWPQIQLDYDPVLLSPKSVLPRLGYLTGPGGAGVTVSDATAQMFDPADRDRPVKAFLQEYQTLFGFGPEAITNATVQRDYVSTGNGARTVGFFPDDPHLVPLVRDHPLPLPWARNPGRRAGLQRPAHRPHHVGGRTGRRDASAPRRVRDAVQYFILCWAVAGVT